MMEEEYTTVDCFIVFSEYGVERMTKNKGMLKKGEVSVRVQIQVPTRCFQQPDISAIITVPESAVNKPNVDVWIDEPSA